MQFLSTALAALAAFSLGATAMPLNSTVVNIGVPPPCARIKTYSVTSKSPSPILGSHSSVIAMTCDGTGGGCTLGASYTYTVSWSIDIGFNLGLAPEDIAESAGLSAGFSYGASKGTGNSVSHSCPEGPWICGISITPWVVKVSGLQTTEYVGLCGSNMGHHTSKPYTVEFPQVINHLPNVNANVCACPNGPGAHAKGAPPLCPTAC